MESLLNFNFLKDISVKKNNEKNANDKSLFGDEKSILINKPDTIENEFNNILDGACVDLGNWADYDVVDLPKTKNIDLEPKTSLKA